MPSGFSREQITGKAGGANADLDFADFTHAAVADAFHGLAEVTAKLRALLAADLIDDVVFAGGFHDLNAARMVTWGFSQYTSFLASAAMMEGSRANDPECRSPRHRRVCQRGFAEILGGFAGVVGAVFIGDTLEAVIEAHLGDFG